MSKVYFYNNGELDIRSAQVMGINVKPTTDNPIGFFGTGFKYGLAVCARIGAKVTIHTGNEVYHLETYQDGFRGKTFDFVRLRRGGTDDEYITLPFTTELGKNWKPWMVVRELGSNARDEGGDFGIRPDEASAYDTVIEVEHDDIYTVAITNNSVFLNDSKVLEHCDQVETHRKVLGNSVYYRGINVGHMEKYSKYTYNILMKIELTEDRTMRVPWHIRVILGVAIQNSGNADYIRDCVMAPTGGESEFAEYHADFDRWTQPSATFMEVVKELLEDNTIISAGAVSLYTKFAPRPARKLLTMDEIVQKKFQKAVRIVKVLGVKCNDHDFSLTETMDASVWAVCDNEDKHIYLSPTLFGRNQAFITSTILEESLHLYENLPNESRELQNRLLELVISNAELLFNDRGD